VTKTSKTIKNRILNVIFLSQHDSFGKMYPAKEINLDKPISLCTDGSPNMIGKYKGFVTLFGQNVKHELLSFHCIVHQEALCAQTFQLKLTKSWH